MPDYSAVFLPGLTMTSQAAGTITGGDPVEVAGSGMVQKTTVGPSAGLGSAACIGIAAHDAIAGGRVTVICDRVVHEGLADGVINAASQVMSSSVAGRQVKAVPVTGGSPGKADVDQARVIIGIALTSAGDGSVVRWMQKLPVPPNPVRASPQASQAGGPFRAPTAPGVGQAHQT